MAKTLQHFIDLVQKEHICLKYAQVRQNGKIIDEYMEMPVKTRLNMWSVSKSFISIGIGIAIDEGLISLNERICDAFPEYVTEKTSPNLLSVTVLDLLTMTSGLETPLFFGDSPERYVVKDWIKYFFEASFTEKARHTFPVQQFQYIHAV